MSHLLPNEPRPAPLTVLAFVPYYLPGYKSGGPVRSIANLVARLGDDLRFVIVTADRDSGDAAPYPHLTPGVRQRVDGADVIYLDASRQRARAMAALVRALHPDVIYLNSFFSPAFSINLVLLRRLHRIPPRPIVLAPRGEFSPGALQVKSPKKRLFLAAARALRLYRNVLWQASTPLEAADIRRSLGPVERDGCSRIIVAPIIASPHPPTAAVSAPDRPAPRSKQADYLRVAFLSRISAKKNLLGALQILQGVRGRLQLDIYGPIQDQPYWRRCREHIAALPPNVQVAYHGPVDAARVPAVLAAHDLFFLPTFGENYGHVIREALAAGTPVLISDQTPWRQLAAAQAGWDLPLERPEAFRDVLERCIAMCPASFVGLSEHAAAYARRHADDGSVVEASRRLFHTAAGGRHPIAIGKSGMINAS